jgi:predicted DNA-binding WGR domain protein
MKTKLLRRLRKKANRKYYLAKYKNEYYFQIREMSMFSEWGKVNEKIALKKLREIY